MSKKIDFVLFILTAIVLVFSVTCYAQTIPAITDLSATSGPGPGEITLRWSVPIFENPSSSADFDCAYEFRTNTEPIGIDNWDESDSTMGKLKPIIGLCASIQLDLYVSSYVDEYLIIHGDEPVLRAWLTIQYDCFNFYFPGATGLRDETIDFEIYYPAVGGSLVYTGSAQTDSHGMAEISDVGDLYDDPEGLGQCSEFKFHFKAKWEGHSIGGAAGSIIVSGDKEDTVDQYLCDAQILIPPLPEWSEFGGEYHYSFPNSHCTFFVPMKALPYDMPVDVQTVISPPGPTGMRPGVTGALEAFTLEPLGQPVFETPISVSLEYAPELLTNPDQLAESSLMAYWYDTGTSSWSQLDEEYFKLDPNTNTITFRTDQTGMFAIAAEIDSDLDSIGDYEELRFGTNPAMDDTDGDGISDGDEILVLQSDPLDPEKTTNTDQHGVITNLTPGATYYVAARIKGVDQQSNVSNCVQVKAGHPDESADINRDGVVNLIDVSYVAGQWLQTIP